jgi:hypothetical protein
MVSLSNPLSGVFCGLSLIEGFFMHNELREKRLRLLVRKVNRDRKKQSKKIDILCNDLIGAHRSFIKNLDVLRFAANFYQSIIGQKNPDRLFETAGKLIKAEISDVNITFVLRQPEGFEIYSSRHHKKDSTEQTFESFFTNEIVNDICKNNRLCSLEEMLTMGLQVVPTMLNTLSAYAVPLIHRGSSIGFVLLYRRNDTKINPDVLDNVVSVSLGLARAVMCCQTVCSKSSENFDDCSA